MTKPKKKNIIREYVEAFGVALIAALVLRAFVIQAFRIPTGSMKDTLLIGDFLLVNKFNYGMRTPDWIGIPLLISVLMSPGFGFLLFENQNLTMLSFSDIPSMRSWTTSNDVLQSKVRLWRLLIKP